MTTTSVPKRTPFFQRTPIRNTILVLSIAMLCLRAYSLFDFIQVTGGIFFDHFTSYWIYLLQCCICIGFILRGKIGLGLAFTCNIALLSLYFLPYNLTISQLLIPTHFRVLLVGAIICSPLGQRIFIDPPLPRKQMRKMALFIPLGLTLGLIPHFFFS
ncbi:hypothetical protein PEDI_23200 [Persicobacter diffluens]|uniref:Uncharacterized protein n=1 Tax=Persicobacter diffluens TaxID=981 RepID=A0AAN5AMD5_9BACT|nr:hypothetical protein PEDI_23200 [Persicobacter diffluens]